MQWGPNGRAEDASEASTTVTLFKYNPKFFGQAHLTSKVTCVFRREFIVSQVTLLAKWTYPEILDYSCHLKRVTV